MQQTPQKPMRELMPVWTEFVDAMREAGLTNNATIAAGLKSGACWVREGDHYIGLPGAKEASDALSANGVKGDDLCIITRAERAQRDAINSRKRGGGA
jgi:hypothetical protein